MSRLRDRRQPYRDGDHATATGTAARRIGTHGHPGLLYRSIAMKSMIRTTMTASRTISSLDSLLHPGSRSTLKARQLSHLDAATCRRYILPQESEDEARDHASAGLGGGTGARVRAVAIARGRPRCRTRSQARA